MRRRVTRLGEAVLEVVAAPVTAFDAKLRVLATDMVETMRAEEGIGLAAPQVGEPLQLFVVELTIPPGEAAPFSWSFDGRELPLALLMPLVVVNPQLELSGPVTDYEEGCLSIPGFRFSVARPDRARLRFQDLDGHWHDLVATGLFSRVLQHEYDHCQGVLMVERAHPPQVRRAAGRLNRFRRETRLLVAESARGNQP